MGLSFDEFLDYYRTTYEVLVESDHVHYAHPGFEVPDIHPNCPEDTQDAHAMAEAFRDVLEDCLSYLAWLQAQSSGFCDV
jgi:hypothetical protein